MLRFFIFSVSFLAAGLPAFSAVIEFSVLDNPNAGITSPAGGTYSTGGFTFSATNLGAWTTGSATHGCISAPLACNPAGGAAAVSLTAFAVGADIVMTSDNNSPFGVSSIDFAQWGPYAANAMPAVTFTATVRGYLQGNLMASQGCTFANLGGTQPVLGTCSLSGFSGLDQLRMTQGDFGQGSAFQFTNVVVPSEGVPEPSTWGLMVGALIVRRLMRTSSELRCKHHDGANANLI